MLASGTKLTMVARKALLLLAMSTWVFIGIPRIHRAGTAVRRTKQNLSHAESQAPAASISNSCPRGHLPTARSAPGFVRGCSGGMAFDSVRVKLCQAQEETHQRHASKMPSLQASRSSGKSASSWCDGWPTSFACRPEIVLASKHALVDVPVARFP